MCDTLEGLESVGVYQSGSIKIIRIFFWNHTQGEKSHENKLLDKIVYIIYNTSANFLSGKSEKKLVKEQRKLSIKMAD